VWDSPNSAGVVIDAIRCIKLAMDRGEGGPLLAASAYFMKSPPVQYNDSEAKELVDAFIRGAGSAGPQEMSGAGSAGPQEMNGAGSAGPQEIGGDDSEFLVEPEKVEVQGNGHAASDELTLERAFEAK